MMKIGNYYKEIQLGYEAYNYLTREHLPYGMSYSRYLIEEIFKSKGRITTFLPIVVQDRNLNKFNGSYIGYIPESFYSEFNNSGLKTPNISPIDEYWSLPLIETFLQEDEQNICIIEDHESKKGDECLSNAPTHWISYGDEIYHVISGKNISSDIILNVFGWVGSWTFVCGLTKFPQKYVLPVGKLSLDEEGMKYLVKNSEKVIISAYDHEGYLIWHRLKD